MLNSPQTNGSPYPRALPNPEAREDATPPALTPFLGVSTALRRLLLQAEITASRLQFAILEGEPGTGKHLFAQTLHQYSALGALPFRRHDAREWLATETDTAVLSGTLYLDRVDLLAPLGQGLLLNFLKMLQGAGPDDPSRPRNFLLLASAHTSLRQLASQGKYLPDLAFRLTAARFPIPPLREHREDIAPIAQALIDRICRRYQQPTAVLASGALPKLLQHTWPGNVRELASILESAILDSHTGILKPHDLKIDPQYDPSHPIHTSRPETTPTLAPKQIQIPPNHEDLTLDAIIHRHIQLVLSLNRGNKLRAARQLGISRSTLYRILAGESTLAS